MLSSPSRLCSFLAWSNRLRVQYEPRPRRISAYGILLLVALMALAGYILYTTPQMPSEPPPLPTMQETPDAG